MNKRTDILLYAFFFLMTAKYKRSTIKAFISSHSLDSVMPPILVICLHKSSPCTPGSCWKEERVTASAQRPSCDPALSNKHCKNELMIRVPESKTLVFLPSGNTCASARPEPWRGLLSAGWKGKEVLCCDTFNFYFTVLMDKLYRCALCTVVHVYPFPFYLSLSSECAQISGFLRGSGQS